MKVSRKNKEQIDLSYSSFTGILKLLATFLVIFSLTGNAAKAQPASFQVQVNAPQTLPAEVYRFETEPLIFFDVYAESPQSYEVIFEVVVENDDIGAVFTVTSDPFQVPQGSWNTQFDNTSVMNGQGGSPDQPHFQTVQVNPQIQAQLAQTGLLPDGLYTICVFVYDSQSGQMFCQGCGNSTVFSPEPVIPISPTACDEVPESGPLFAWTPIQFDNSVHYRITVFNVLEGQSPEEALGNPPHAVEELFNQTTFQYPASAPTLEAGQYIWIVEAINPEGQALTDPPFGEFECFTVPGTDVPVPEDPVSDTASDITDKVPSPRDSVTTPGNPTIPGNTIPGITDQPGKPDAPQTNPTVPNTTTPGITDAPDKPDNQDNPDPTTNPSSPATADNPVTPDNPAESDTPGTVRPPQETSNELHPGYITLINPKDCSDFADTYEGEDGDQFAVTWEFSGDFDQFIIYVDASGTMAPGEAGQDVSISAFENFPFSKKIIRPNNYKGKKGKQVQEANIDILSNWWNQFIRIFVAGTHSANGQTTVGGTSGTGCTKFVYKTNPDSIPTVSVPDEPLEPPGPGDKIPNKCAYETTKTLLGSTPQVSAVIAEDGTYNPPGSGSSSGTIGNTSRYLYPRAVPLLGLSIDEDEIQFICKGCPDQQGVKAMMVRDEMSRINWEIIDGPGTLNTPPKVIEDIRKQIEAKEDSIQNAQKRINDLQNKISLHLDRSISGYNKEVGRITTDITSLNSAKAALTGENGKLSKSIEDIKKEISELEKSRKAIEKEIQDIRKEQQKRMEDLDWKPSIEELDALSKIDLYRDEMQKAADELEDLRVTAAAQVESGSKQNEESKDALDKAQKEYDDSLDGEAYAANELAGLKNSMWKEKSQIIILFNEMLILKQAVGENNPEPDDVAGYKKIKDQIHLMLKTASSVTRKEQVIVLKGLIDDYKIEAPGLYDHILSDVLLAATNVSELEDFDVGLITRIKELFDKLKELEELSEKRKKKFVELEKKATAYKESLEKFKADMSKLESSLLDKTKKLHSKSQVLGDRESKAHILQETNRGEIESGVVDVWTEIEKMDEKLIGLKEAMLDSIAITTDHLQQLLTATNGKLDQIIESIATISLEINGKKSAVEKIKGLIDDANTENGKLNKEIGELQSKIESCREEIEALLKKVQELEEKSKATGFAVYYVPPPLESIFEENGTIDAFNDLKINSSRAKEEWQKAWNQKAGLQKELTADIEKIAALAIEMEASSRIKEEKEAELSDIQKEEKALIAKKDKKFDQQWEGLDNNWEQLDMRINIAEKKVDSLQKVQDELTKTTGPITTTVKEIQAIRGNMEGLRNKVKTTKKTWESRLAESQKVQQAFLNHQRELRALQADLDQLVNALSDVETSLGIEMAKAGGESIEECPTGLVHFPFEKFPNIRNLWDKQIDLTSDTSKLSAKMKEVEKKISKKTIEFQEINTKVRKGKSAFSAADSTLRYTSKKLKQLYQNLDSLNNPLEAVFNDKMDWKTYLKRKKKEQKLVVKSMDGNRENRQGYINNLRKNDPEIKDKKAKIIELGSIIAKQERIINSLTDEINALIVKRPILEKARQDSLDLAEKNYKTAEKALESFLSESFKKTTYSVKIKQSVTDYAIDKWRTLDGPVADTLTLEYKNRLPKLIAKKLSKGSAADVGSPCFPVITLKKNGDPAYKFSSKLVKEPVTYALLHEKGKKLWKDWPVLKGEDVLTDQVSLIEGSKGIDADAIIFKTCTGGPGCPFVGQPVETDIADLSSHQATPLKGSVVGQYKFHPDIFWEAGKVKGEEESQRITFQQNYSGIVGPESAGNKTDVDVKPGELVGILDTIKATPKEKINLTARVVTGNYKGLKEETVTFEIQENGTKKELQTDEEGFVEWEYTLPEKGLASVVSVSWKHDGAEIVKDTIYLITPLYLQNVRLEKGAPDYAWKTALELYKNGVGVIGMAIISELNSNKSSQAETGPAIRTVAGLTDEKADFVNKKELNFKILKSAPSATLDPAKEETKVIGIAATTASFSSQKEEMKLTVEVASSGDYNSQLLPEKLKMEYESSQVEYIRIGDKKSGFVFKLESKQSRQGPLSGTAKFWFKPEDAVQEALLKAIQKLPVELMGIEGRNLDKGPDGKKNLLVVDKGTIAWIPEKKNRPEVNLKGGFKLQMTGFSVSIEGGAGIEGLLKDSGGKYLTDPVSFKAKMDKKGNFYGMAASLPEFSFKGYKLRKGSSVVIDMHEKISISDKAAPALIRKPKFLGIVVRVAELEFPEEFSAGKDDETAAMALNAQDFYIGNEGIGGDLTLKNTTLQVKFAGYLLTGKSVKVVFENTAIKAFKIGGEFRLPSPTRGTLEGTIGFDSTNGVYEATVKTKAGEAIDIRKLDAKLDLNEGTIRWISASGKQEGYGELKIDAKFISRYNSELDIELEASSKGIVSGKLKGEKEISFYKSFAYTAKELEFHIAKDSTRIALSGDLKLTRMDFKGDLVSKIILTSGPKVDFEFTDAKIEVNKGPFEGTGLLSYKSNEFAAAIDLKLAKANKGFGGTLVMGSHEGKNKKEAYSYWYAELAVSGDVPLGQTGLSVKEIRGGLGYNYVPPLNPGELGSHKKVGMAFKASSTIGIIGVDFFKATAGLHWLQSGIIKINGDVRLELQKALINGSGLLSFDYNQNKVNGNFKMSGNFPDQKGRLFRFDSKFHFKFDSGFLTDNNYVFLKSERINGVLLDFIYAKGSLVASKSKVRFDGSFTGKWKQHFKVKDYINSTWVDCLGNPGLNVRAEFKLKGHMELNIKAKKWDSSVKMPYIKADGNIVVGNRYWNLPNLNASGDLKLTVNSTMATLGGGVKSSVSFAGIHKDINLNFNFNKYF